MMNKMIIFTIITLLMVKVSLSQVTANFQQNNSSFCGINNTLTVTDISTGAFTRTWTITGPGGFTTFNGTNTSEDVILTQLGVYSINLNVCDAAGTTCDSKSVTVFVNDKPTAVIDVTDTIVCIGTSIVFNSTSSTFSTAGANYYWDSDYNTGIDEFTSSFTFLANGDKTIMLVVEDDNNCTDTAFQNISIITEDEANFEIGPQCVGEAFDLVSTSFSNNPLVNTYWLLDSTTTINGASISYTHPVAETISIILFIENSFGCSDGIQKFVTIEAKPDITLNITDTTICEGETIEIIANGADLYSWSEGSDSNSIKVTPENTTTYTVTGTSPSGVCSSDEKDVSISILEKPEINFESNDFTPIVGTPINIVASYNPQFSTKDSLIWLAHNTSNELENTYGLENSFIAKENVSFPVQLTYYNQQYKCTLLDSVSFEVDLNCNKDNIFVPNVFTPNGDLKNDDIKISGYSIASILEFVIFDRLGMEVYHANSIEMKNGKSILGWNGKNKNNVLCNSGVYVYYYKLNCINGGEIEASGNITLIR